MQKEKVNEEAGETAAPLDERVSPSQNIPKYPKISQISTPTERAVPDPMEVSGETTEDETEDETEKRERLTRQKCECPLVYP